MDAPMIKSLNNCDDVNCINTARSRGSKDGDQHMFLQREWPWIQQKRPFCEWHSDWSGGKGCSHEFPKWEGNNRRETEEIFKGLVL